MICSKCRHEIPDGSKFCEYCGSPVVSEAPSAGQVAEEPAVIAEEPAFIAEEPAVTEKAPAVAQKVSDDPPASADQSTAEPENVSESSVDAILAETLTSHSATAVLDKNSDIPQDTESGYSGPQSAERLERTKSVKKLNLPASVAVCIAFGLLMTVFSAASVAISSVRKTLVRGAVSEQIEELDIGDIVIGDTDLANEIVDKRKLSDDSTISDVVKITLEDYEKYILRGMFEENSVTVADIQNIDNVDLNGLVGKIDGVNSINDLDIDAIVENLSKLDKNELNAIVNKYSKEDFPELTFEIDKRKVEDLLNKSNSPAKAYISDVVKAYENYMLTGEDTKPFSVAKLNTLAQESVGYILEGMDSSYVDEINKEMAQVVSENKAMLNSCNPSSFFGVFGSILPMSLSTVTVFVSLGLAVVFAAAAALITKRIDAAGITLGVSFIIAGGAAFAVNALPANLAQFTGLDYRIVSKTAANIVKETFAGDFTVMGIRSLVVGVVIIAAVVVTKVVMRAVKNKKG